MILYKVVLMLLGWTQQFQRDVIFHVQHNIPKGLLLGQEQLSVVLSSYLQNLNHQNIQEEFLLI